MWIIVCLFELGLCTQLGRITGTLYTPKKYPADNVVVSFAAGLLIVNQTTNPTGSFALQFEIDTNVLIGQLQLNLANQYYKQLSITLSPDNKYTQSLGSIVLDNGLIEQTSIQGCVIAEDTQQPLIKANVTAIYNKPTLLDQQTTFTGADGCFQLSDQLMKLMIYQVDVLVTVDGYQQFTCDDSSSPCYPGINLYNTYKYQFPYNIIMTPFYIPVEIVLQLNTKEGQSVSISCQQSQSIAYMESFLTDADGEIDVVVQKVFKKGLFYACAAIAVQPNQVGSCTFIIPNDNNQVRCNIIIAPPKSTSSPSQQSSISSKSSGTTPPQSSSSSSSSISPSSSSSSITSPQPKSQPTSSSSPPPKSSTPSPSSSSSIPPPTSSSSSSTPSPLSSSTQSPVSPSSSSSMEPPSKSSSPSSSSSSIPSLSPPKSSSPSSSSSIPPPPPKSPSSSPSSPSSSSSTPPPPKSSSSPSSSSSSTPPPPKSSSSPSTPPPPPPSSPTSHSSSSSQPQLSTTYTNYTGRVDEMSNPSCSSNYQIWLSGVQLTFYYQTTLAGQITEMYQVNTTETGQDGSFWMIVRHPSLMGYYTGIITLIRVGFVENQVMIDIDVDSGDYNQTVNVGTLQMMPYSGPPECTQN